MTAKITRSIISVGSLTTRRIRNVWSVVYLSHRVFALKMSVSILRGSRLESDRLLMLRSQDLIRHLQMRRGRGALGTPFDLAGLPLANELPFRRTTLCFQVARYAHT